MAAIVTASCGKTYVPQPFEGLALTLAVDGASTKAGTVAATDEESEISSVAVYACKADGSHGDFRKLSVKNLEKTEDTSYPYHATVNVAGMGGDWSLYVIANPPSGLGEFGSYAEMIAAIEGSSSPSSLWTADNFLMFNKYNASAGTDPSYDDDLVGKIVSLGGDSPETSINLDRLAVKVLALSDDFIDFTPYHTVVPGSTDTYVISGIKIDGAALLNCVNSFSLFPSHTSTTPVQIVSPSSSVSYPLASGYYDAVPTDLSFTAFDTDIDAIPALYCLENNSPLYADLVSDPGQAVDGTKMKGRVTAVIFRAQVSLANGFNSDAVITDPIVVDPTPGEWQTKSVFTDEPRTFYRYKNSYFADFDLLKAAYPDLGTNNDPTVLRGKGVKVYEDGHMYYTYWIKDTNDILSVARNTCYSLTVNTIASFGDDVPGGNGYNASDPVQSKEPSIGVTLKISDWTDVSSDKTL